MHSSVQLANSVQVTEIIHCALIHCTLWGNTRTASVYQITVSVHYTAVVITCQCHPLTAEILKLNGQVVCLLITKVFGKKKATQIPNSVGEKYLRLRR